jgi:hypothetical protein
MREYTHNRGVPPAAWQGPSLKITQKPTREIYRKDVALTAALALIQEHGASVPQLLTNHQTGIGWKVLCAEDRDANWRAAFGGERVLSAFNIGSVDHPVKLWIITEWDRSVTTILRPQDY